MLLRSSYLLAGPKLTLWKDRAALMGVVGVDGQVSCVDMSVHVCVRVCVCVFRLRETGIC